MAPTWTRASNCRDDRPDARRVSGSSRGAISQRYGSATAKAVAAVAVNANSPSGSMPRSVAIDRTSRLVDVPMLVIMPPARIAKFTGINVRDAECPVRSARLRSIGSISTSTGVSLTKALATPATTSVTSSPSETVESPELAEDADRRLHGAGHRQSAARESSGCRSRPVQDGRRRERHRDPSAGLVCPS